MINEACNSQLRGARNRSRSKYRSGMPPIMSWGSRIAYQLYFAPKVQLQRVMQRWPSTTQPIEACKSWIRQSLLPNGKEWVEVRSGLSAGLMMRLKFPEEAGVWLGENEPEVQSAVMAAVRPGWVVFDIGSYIGGFALGVAKMVGAKGHVRAFDGDPINVARLREHAAANGLGDVLQTEHAAVWSSDDNSVMSFRCGKVMRSQGGVESGDIRPILGTGELIHVPVTTLDRVIASSGLVPELIKIDVEGGEAEVLRGGEQLFSTARPSLIVEIHTVQARDAARVWLQEHAYSAYELPLADPVPMRLFAWPQEQHPGPWPKKEELTPTIAFPSKQLDRSASRKGAPSQRELL